MARITMPGALSPLCRHNIMNMASELKQLRMYNIFKERRLSYFMLEAEVKLTHYTYVNF